MEALGFDRLAYELLAANWAAEILFRPSPKMASSQFANPPKRLYLQAVSSIYEHTYCTTIGPAADHRRTE